METGASAIRNVAISTLAGIVQDGTLAEYAAELVTGYRLTRPEGQTRMADNLCRHGRKVCSECQHVTDAGKRAYDIARSYCAFTDYETRVRSWIAFRLEDGGSDGTLYDSKRDAIRHQSYEQQCAYFSFRGAPNGFATAKDAALWLEYHRHMYDHGGRLVDPDDAHGGPDIIMPTAKEQLMDQFWRLARRAVN